LLRALKVGNYLTFEALKNLPMFLMNSEEKWRECELNSIGGAAFFVNA
jgi:hypothetical protein